LLLIIGLRTLVLESGSAPGSLSLEFWDMLGQEMTQNQTDVW